jgi:FlaA1/EpsC-like NDP-sugar epimerase
LEIAPGPFFTNAIVLALMIFTFRTVFGFYKNVWRYTYTKAYLSAILEDAAAAVVSTLIAFIVRGFINKSFVFKMWQFVVISTLFCLVTLG